MAPNHGPPSHIQGQIGILLHWWCITGKTMGSLKPTIGFEVWLRLLISVQWLQGSSFGWEVHFLLLTNSTVDRALAHLTFFSCLFLGIFLLVQHCLCESREPLTHSLDWKLCSFLSWLFFLARLHTSSFLSAILPTGLVYICFETHFSSKSECVLHYVSKCYLRIYIFKSKWYSTCSSPIVRW